MTKRITEPRQDVACFVNIHNSCALLPFRKLHMLHDVYIWKDHTYPCQQIDGVLALLAVQAGCHRIVRRHRGAVRPQHGGAGSYLCARAEGDGSHLHTPLQSCRCHGWPGGHAWHFEYTVFSIMHARSLLNSADSMVDAEDCMLCCA